jgi:hypothetical protein
MKFPIALSQDGLGAPNNNLSGYVSTKMYERKRINIGAMHISAMPPNLRYVPARKSVSNIGIAQIIKTPSVAASGVCTNIIAKNDPIAAIVQMIIRSFIATTTTRKLTGRNAIPAHDDMLPQDIGTPGTSG